jgi:thiol-disulfide isomerase/thioredoxin
MTRPTADLRTRLSNALLCLLALGFSLAANAADTLNLDAYRGKVVLVDFWASWCAPCRQSFPWLNELQAKYADRGLVVLGVNVDRTRADAENFLRDVPARFDIVYDPEGALAARYDIPGMPSSFVFDPDGALVARHIGFRNADRAQREAEITKLLPNAAR